MRFINSTCSEIVYLIIHKRRPLPVHIEIKHETQRIDVYRIVIISALVYLRRKKTYRSFLRISSQSILHLPCDPEIAELIHSKLIAEQIVRLNIPMNDTFLFTTLQCGTYVFPDLYRFIIIRISHSLLVLLY